MDGNQEQGNMRWPDMEYVQFHFTDSLGNTVQQATLTESQLLELSAAGFSITYQYANEHDVNTDSQGAITDGQVPLPTSSQTGELLTETFIGVSESQNMQQEIDETRLMGVSDAFNFNQAIQPDVKTVYVNRSYADLAKEAGLRQALLNGSEEIVGPDTGSSVQMNSYNSNVLHSQQSVIYKEEPLDRQQIQQSNIQDSLKQLRALQSSDPIIDDHNTRSATVATSIFASPAYSSAVSSVDASSRTQSSVIMNVGGVRQEIPISICLDGKEYTFETQGKESSSAVWREAKIAQPLAVLGKQLLPTAYYVDMSHTSAKESISTAQTHTNSNSDGAATTDTAQAGNVSRLDYVFHEDPSVISQMLAVEGEADKLESEPKTRIIQLVRARKSERLAVKQEKVVFNPEEHQYDVNQLWCELCQRAYPEGCSKHRVSTVLDTVVRSRAWASLPASLAIYKLKDEPGSDLGVFAKKPINKLMQFGPFVAETVTSKAELSDNCPFLLSIESDTGWLYLRTADEDKCNWMIFVRPAQSYELQNLIAHQYGPDIFFTAIKDISAKEELKVWYAAPYAHRIGENLLISPEEKSKETDPNEKFECYECEATLKTAALLEMHLEEHEAKETAAQLDAHQVLEDAQKRVKKELSAVDDEETDDAHERSTEDETFDPKKLGRKANDEFQSWKKRKRNMYLNKINRYREISKRMEQKRLQGQEIQATCEPCDVTFSNKTVYDLHLLTHSENADGVLVDQLSEQAMDESLLKEISVPKDGDGIRALRCSFRCPVCRMTFQTIQCLVLHAMVHSKRKHRIVDSYVVRRVSEPSKPHACIFCSKSFAAATQLSAHLMTHQHAHYDRSNCIFCSKSFAAAMQLSAHLMTHQHAHYDRSKPLTCDICGKVLKNNSALTVHMKIHSRHSYFTCPMCRKGFERNQDLKEHAKSHMVNNLYPCSQCHKCFKDLRIIKQHVRVHHSFNEIPCPVCQKVFTRYCKFRLHMTRHSSKKDFMCDQCGRQFKRKDKLKDHIKRMHDPSNPKLGPIRPFDNNGALRQRFQPRVLPTEFHRFVYKCQRCLLGFKRRGFVYKCQCCLLGFKRRGMLVNHLAKRHPDIPVDSVPELQLPILRTQRDYFCNYCDKVYKSSAKRKIHIQKNHPGASLPAPQGQISDYHMLSDATYSQLSGSITAHAYKCNMCHKQYASKSRMVHHQRKDHKQDVITRRKRTNGAGQEKRNNELASAYEYPDGEAVVVESQGSQHQDLLTQAMSELTQNLGITPATGDQAAGGEHTAFTITLPQLGQHLQGMEVADRGEGLGTSLSVSNGSMVLAPGQTIDLAALGRALMQGGFTATFVTDTGETDILDASKVIGKSQLETTQRESILRQQM